MKQLILGLLFGAITISNAFSMSLEMDRSYDFSSLAESRIPDTFLVKPTEYINHGGIAKAIIQFVPRSQELTITYTGTLTPGRASIGNYKQVYQCHDFNKPCRLLQDELGYAKGLTIFSDGSMLYENNFGVVTSMVNMTLIINVAKSSLP